MTHSKSALAAVVIALGAFATTADAAEFTSYPASQVRTANVWAAMQRGREAEQRNQAAAEALRTQRLQNQLLQLQIQQIQRQQQPPTIPLGRAYK